MQLTTVAHHHVVFSPGGGEPGVDYLGFEIKIQRFEGAYRAHVLSSPRGEGSTDFALPFHEGELQQFPWLAEGAWRDARPADQVSPVQALSPRDFGARLFEAVFGRQVGLLFQRSLDRALDQEMGLRLRFRLDEVPELADLPWEYLYDTKRDHFVALSDRTPIVRYLAVEQPQAPLEVSPPLRILVVVSDPSDLPPLNVEEEWHRLRRALVNLEDRGLVVLERLENPTLVSLMHRLRKGEGVHVLHVIGHGYFSASDNEGVLIFEDEAGKSQQVPAENLATVLQNHDPLRLVFLNTCKSAAGERAAPFSGVAQKLVQQGLPAVVAMQIEISDAAALDLAHEFYAALADGCPVDTALTQARIRLKIGGSDLEWGTPVLYSRAPDNRLFAVPEPEPTLALGRFEPETVPVRRGVFVMGSDPGEGVPEYETSQHEVYLPDYRIGRYPVTNREYYEFIKRTGALPAPELGWPGMKPAREQMNLPVAGVTWYRAVEYCRWLSAETGRRYALPSEAQWEKAARGPTGQRFPWGDDWQDGRHCNTDAQRITAPGAYEGGKSPYGCYDMVGNVGEWTTTLWGSKNRTPDDDYRYPWPADGGEDGRNDLAANERVRRVYRGGAREHSQGPLRASQRGCQLPRQVRFPGVRLGFRVVLEEESGP
jgi:formylglycine-generating enzyme required for sulfatase activity